VNSPINSHYFPRHPTIRPQNCFAARQTFDGHLRTVYYWQVVGGASQDATQRQDAQAGSLDFSARRGAGVTTRNDVTEGNDFAEEYTAKSSPDF
jgi:hypothetical protein